MMLCEIPELNGPWIHEHDLDIEDHKQHRNQIKFNRETRRATANWQHAAFVCGVFGRVPTCRTAKHHAEQKRRHGKSAGDKDLE